MAGKTTKSPTKKMAGSKKSCPGKGMPGKMM